MVLNSSVSNFKKLICAHLVILTLVIAYFIPLTFSWISWVDIQGAYFFNSFLSGNLFWHKFWNFLRSSKMDWCFDIIMLAFALYYILTKEKTYRRKLTECILLVLFTIACFLPVHRGPIQAMIRPVRICPLGTLSEITPLSKQVTGESRKGFTDHSYPSDHGYTVFMFIFACCFLRGRRFGLSALLVSLPVLTARLVTGTHWISDITLGSIPIALFNISWFFYSLNLKRLHLVSE